jgi:phosphatidate phosphatase APP1
VDARDEQPLVHRAARIESAVTDVLDKRLRARGYAPRVIPYSGYGGDGWARVLARVILVPPASDGVAADLRGWRRFAVTSATRVPVTVRLGSRVHEVASDRDGYIDLRLESDLPAGWQNAQLSVAGADPVPAPIRVVPADATTGLISDLDDTVIVTMLPRPVLAFRNAFLVRESTRDPVPGMAALYGDLAAAHPGLFVVYVSTGAWNAAGPMTRFLQRHGFPAGPLLMTDWGPTAESWFRSGQAHKRAQLKRLFEEFPDLDWLLIGDDGQHDPELYAEATAAHPDRVRAVALRQLTLGERAAHVALGGPARSEEIRAVVVRAPDGQGLRSALVRHGLLPR